MPCERCGASVETRAALAHLCDGERWLDFKLFELRGEIESFDDALGGWLATPRGRFEQFYAERERGRPPID
jgi:hypothetical protein